MATQNKIALAFKYLLDRDYRDYRRIRNLNVFDPDYFEVLVKRDGSNDLIEGLDAAKDPLWYYFQVFRSQLASVEVLSDTWSQFFDPCPLFDTYFYMAKYRTQVGSRNPFSHYLLEGWRSDLKPSPYFDPGYYRDNSHWHEESGNPLQYYLEHDLQRAQDCSIFFSHSWYLDRTPLPRALQLNAIKHYKLYGSTAGKSPVPLFEPDHYTHQVKDLTVACTDPLLHYLSAGESLGTSPSPHFDPEYYRTHCQVGEADASPLAHYLSKGVFEKCVINRSIASLDSTPVISIIVPVYNPRPEFLNNCIRSVLYQTYPHWELWLIDDCSSAAETRDILTHWAAQDQRINCLFNDSNRGISATTQIGVDNASGDYLGFLDNDDELAADCLFQVTKEINRSRAEVIYTDEDLIGDDGSRHEAFYKPGFNRALLFSHNYITHFVVAESGLVERCGGFNSDYDGAQDFDLILRLTSRANRVRHISKILYHWRAVATSTSIDHEAKPYAHEAGKNALQAYLDREMQALRVDDTSLNYHYRIRNDLEEEPSVTVLFINENDEERIIDLEKLTDYSNCEFRLISDLNSEGGTHEPGRQKGMVDVTEVEIVQTAINSCSTDYIAILDKGTKEVASDWLTELVSQSYLDEDIAVVCGRVSYSGDDGPSYTLPDVQNRTVAHYGSFLVSASRHANGLHNLQYVNGCDFKICLIRRSILTDLGGFDVNQFPHYLAMLDFCYRVLDRGHKILYTPNAVAIYDRNLSYDADEAEQDVKEKYSFQQRHHRQLAAFDQWYNSGQLSKGGISREEFFKWLTGEDGIQPLT